MHPTSPSLDLAGLGIGPFNLSIAALLDSQPTLKARFFDRKPVFSWHPGLMLPGAHMQTSCLKDLVTAIQPTSPWSFMAYLVEKGRFYQFLSTEKLVISRQEFVDYMGWVADKLPNLTFGADIREVRFEGNQFQIHFDQQTVTANNICLGTGKSPYVPDCARGHLSATCFHAIDLGHKTPDLSGKRLAIVGGGQTGAEIFLNSLRGLWGEAAEIHWVSRRPNLEPLDESPFTNEYFTPGYVDYFFILPETQKQSIVQRQKLASDGITPAYLLEIYRELYDRTSFREPQSTRWSVLPDRSLCQLKKNGLSYQVVMDNALSQQRETLEADIIILCTGFEYRLPDYLEPLQPQLHLDQHNHHYCLTENFRVQWDGPNDRRIYAVNAGLQSHGIAEPQLSLTAWRSARIINDLIGKSLLDTEPETELIQWSPQAHNMDRYVAA